MTCVKIAVIGLSLVTASGLLGLAANAEPVVGPANPGARIGMARGAMSPRVNFSSHNIENAPWPQAVRQRYVGEGRSVYAPGYGYTPAAPYYGR